MEGLIRKNLHQSLQLKHGGTAADFLQVQPEFLQGVLHRKQGKEHIKLCGNRKEVEQSSRFLKWDFWFCMDNDRDSDSSSDQIKVVEHLTEPWIIVIFTIKIPQKGSRVYKRLISFIEGSVLYVTSQLKFIFLCASAVGTYHK